MFASSQSLVQHHQRFSSPALVASTSRARTHTSLKKRANAVAVVVAGPTTVADTKAKFTQGYPYPLPSIWATVLQELLVGLHFTVTSSKYQHEEMRSLGFVSVFDQLFEGYPQEDPNAKEKIFNTFMEALGQDPKQWRADAERLSAFAAEQTSMDGILANPMFASMKSKVESKSLVYDKFIAIGFFRALETSKQTSPENLKMISEASGVTLAKINGDLGLYKSVLSRMNSAKELQAEVLERERRKTAERMEKKAAKEAEEAQKEEAQASE
jgi:photosystem II biogenesis protein Psp29